jgi:hypothetical protein
VGSSAVRCDARLVGMSERCHLRQATTRTSCVTAPPTDAGYADRNGSSVAAVRVAGIDRLREGVRLALMLAPGSSAWHCWGS